MVGDMQKNMGAMMSNTGDPALKAQMQKMHEQMSTMMDRMHKMGSDMMGGSMTESSSPKAEQKPETAPTPPVSPEDHKSHHPQQ